MDGSLGTWFAVISVANEFHEYPSVAFNPVNEEYLVTWNYLYGPSDLDIFGSFVSWNGGSIGTPFVIRSDADDQVLPEVVYNPNDDEFLVVYTNNWAGGLWDVAAQRVDADGTLLSWANIASTSGVDRYAATAAFSPELDTYVIGYARDTGTPSTIEMSGKLAAPDLLGVSAEPDITFFGSSGVGAWNPTVGAFGNVFFAQCNLNVQPRARRIAADGTPLGPANGIPLGTQTNMGSAHPTRSSAVARADAVGFVSAWHEQRSSPIWDVYAQVVAPGLDGVSSPVFTVANSASDESHSDIACAPWGTCLVVYNKDDDIAGRILRLDIFGDGFDDTGDPSRWSTVIP
jgi:hypothetical protein